MNAHGGDQDGDRACSEGPLAYAARRPWRLPSPTPVALNSLRQAWDHSRSTIDVIRLALNKADLPACVRSIAVSGSLGRMEFTCHSDVDLIMIAEPGTDRRTRAEAGHLVWNALADLEFRRPLSDGIFATPVDEALLASRASLGEIDEPKAVFGIRMQLLLDSQPIFGDDRFERLLERILNRYRPDPAVDSLMNALLDDLIRYHRSLRTIYRWTRRDEAVAWRSRDIKMTHSRLLIFAGLLFLLGESSSRVRGRARGVVPWLTEQMRLTPLERLATSIADAHERQHVTEILRRYDRFLARLGRHDYPELIAIDEQGGSNGLYRELRHNGEVLSDELFALLLRRLPRWKADFRKKIVFGC